MELGAFLGGVSDWEASRKKTRSYNDVNFYHYKGGIELCGFGERKGKE